MWIHYCTLWLSSQTADRPRPTTTRSHEHEREPDITREEVQTALRALPNDKAPGIGTPIIIELWQSSGEEWVTLLCKLCGKIWRCKEWSKDWCRGISMPIYKKGNFCERMLELSHDQPYGPCQQGPSEDHCLKNPTEIFIQDQ